jgi:hypothetical protein
MDYDEYLDQLERENEQYFKDLEDASIGILSEWTGEDEEEMRARYEEFLRGDGEEND